MLQNRLLSKLIRNPIVYIVAALALGGTAYASVNAIKSGITCGGRCPATTVMWAYFGQGVAGGLSPGFGLVQSPVGGIPATAVQTGVGAWNVTFTGQDLWNCAKFADLTSVRGSATAGGYNSTNSDSTSFPVQTTDANGNPITTGFVVFVMCANSTGLHKPGSPPPG